MTEQPPDSRPAIAAAVIVHDGRVLMVRRRVTEGSLSWQFPAGQVEDGESDEQAAVRETAEETGLTVRAVGYIGDRVHPTTGRTMAYIACEAVAGNAHVADEEELDAVAWCTTALLTEYVPYPLFEPVQRYLDSALKDK
ncbi:8-oxo-dGTP diphosphatase [Allocatelliglobosispora scoriae]|uniref:8-oxo-dGTP diphosphatase n=1 Tax=Allocatelliglobosispora scoriae TaxID=643052 RepID=A0A841BCI4_9ACTN|nr:NUDIX hydrolase [Allocatelliglobosispora scoriae]MBB5866817.1 8-oxo-dGTP diphosphatase [Allocatelliglobosispora scoriae]